MSIRIMNTVWTAAGLRQLKPVQLLVLLSMADFADDEGGSIFPSYQTLATKCNVSRRTIIRVVGQLEEAGVIVKYLNAGRYNGENEYRIVIHALASDIGSLATSDKMSPPSDTGSPPLVTKDHPLVTTAPSASDTGSPNPVKDPPLDPSIDPAPNGAGISENAERLAPAPQLEPDGRPTCLREKTIYGAERWTWTLHPGEMTLSVGIPYGIEWARSAWMMQIEKAMQLDPGFDGWAIEFVAIETEAE